MVIVHGHFYGNFTGNLAHAQSVCTRPFSRGEGPGDEASGYLFCMSCRSEENPAL